MEFTVSKVFLNLGFGIFKYEEMTIQSIALKYAMRFNLEKKEAILEVWDGSQIH